MIDKRASISPLVRPTRSGENEIEKAYAFSSSLPERLKKPAPRAVEKIRSKRRSLLFLLNPNDKFVLIIPHPPNTRNHRMKIYSYNFIDKI